MPRLQHIVVNKLTSDQIHELQKDVSDVEVQLALFSMQQGKAPRPDGFPVEFFVKNWGVVQADFIKAVKHCFGNDSLHTRLNSTIISLIPKVPNLSTMHEYRPISCCNTVYKVYSKILTERMKRILPELISNRQNIFSKEG